MSRKHAAAARVVFRIDDEEARDASLAGHKAASLARLTALGFPVPPGVVVSTDAVDRIRALKLRWPKVTPEMQAANDEARHLLDAEPDD